TAHISILIVRTDLELEGTKSTIHGLEREFTYLRVVISHPPYGGVVAGIASLQNCLAVLSSRSFIAQHGNRFVMRENIFEIAQVQRRHKFFVIEIEEQFPERYTAALGPKIPARICN